MVDINADGWLDIYVCNSGHMRAVPEKPALHQSTKQHVQRRSGSLWPGHFSLLHTGFLFDYDLDGDLDMFLINNSPHADQ
jgi:hypothetical protein